MPTERIDSTPRWTAILPTWLQMYEQGVTGDCANPALVRSNARAEFFRMADAADKYGDLITWMQDSEGWSEDTIRQALAIGKRLSEQKKGQ